MGRVNSPSQRPALKPPISGKDEQLLTTLSFAMVLGMVVALAFCGVWKFHPALLRGSLQYVALTLCPSFLLFTVLGDFDNLLAVVMTIGTIVLANGFLYAGAAAGLYFVVTRFLVVRKRR
jgi:hypothetical protein